jgi:hypothetical protein
MAKKRKAKKRAVKAKGRGAKRAPARKKKIAAKRKPARKAKKAKAKVKSGSGRRKARTATPPRGRAESAFVPRPMAQPGPAVTEMAPRPSPFPSSVPGDFLAQTPDGDKND